MPTRLLIVRHGDSHHKREGVVGGPLACRGLTDADREQAARLRDRLVRDPGLVPPLHLYASGLPRTLETARIVASGLGDLPVAVEPGLGSWLVPPEVDGMPTLEFQKGYAAAGGGVFRPFETVSESWSELVSRVGRALWGLAQRHRGETVLAFAHAEVVSASFVVLGGLPLFPPFDVRPANTSLCEWATDEDTAAWPPARWTLARLGDAAHLAEPL